MIDQWSEDRTGFAQFSDDMVMRYHLFRLVSDRAREIGGDIIIPVLLAGSGPGHGLQVATWLMLNPSDADAFKPDPTVTVCVKFTRRWGHDIAWVVNQHAFRSPYPSDLKKRAYGQRGDDMINGEAIFLACRQANIVIAAWGVDGNLDHRDVVVRQSLTAAGIALHHLGTTQGGHPKHPLARGRHRVPADQQPIPWSP